MCFMEAIEKSYRSSNHHLQFWQFNYYYILLIIFSERKIKLTVIAKNINFDKQLLKYFTNMAI